MINFDSNIRTIDIISILITTGFKFLRGIKVRFFLNQVHGLFLVGKHVQISHAHNIICGKGVKFEDYVEIQGLSSEKIVIGDYVTLSRGVMIRPSSYYGGDLGKGLEIGHNSSIGPYGYVGCSGKIKIGNNVMFGPKCSLFAENHNFNDNLQSIKNQGVNQKGIIVEDDCWIGSNVIILDGVKIGKGSVIGAGTVITNDVPSGSIVIDKKDKRIRSRMENNK